MASIAAIISADPNGAQQVLGAAVARWQGRLHIVGLTEEALSGSSRLPGTLVSIGDGRRFPIR